MAGDYEKAKEAALEMRELFGEDGYYLELQDHKLPNDPAINQGSSASTRRRASPWW